MMSIYIYRRLGPAVEFNAAMTDRLPGISTITTVRALGHNRLRWAKLRGLSIGQLERLVNKFYNVQSASISQNYEHVTQNCNKTLSRYKTVILLITPKRCLTLHSDAYLQEIILQHDKLIFIALEI